MLCGVIGGVAEPTIRKLLSMLLANKSSSNIPDTIIQQHNDANLKKIEEGEEKPVGVEFLAAISYLLCSLLLLTPILVNHSSNNAFSIALLSFLLYEVLIGLYMPCEGVIRTMYMPNESICSLMTMLRVIINVIVAAGVFSTNFVSFTSAFAAGSMSMFIAFVLQLTLIDKSQLENFSRNVLRVFCPVPSLVKA